MSVDQGIDLFILAGEPSGDLLGASLIQELLSINPSLRIAAVAGPHMRKYPIQCIEPMENLQVMGFLDVLFAFPKIAKLFFFLRKKILTLNPKAFVGIDYPGFNLRMHRSLKNQGFKGKLIHYICPTVWAWGKKRIPLMAKNLDLLLTILPFEPKCFEKTTLTAQYVGHPLVAAISAFQYDKTFRSRFGWGEEDKILALFPGSRKIEVERNLPLMLKTAEKLKRQDPDLRIVISGGQSSLSIPLSEHYNLMHSAYLALAKSGTVTLELALHRTPTVVQYAIRPVDVFLATKIFRIHLPYYSLPNIILQKELFPELFGPHLTEENHLAQAETLWKENQKRQKIQTDCQELYRILGTEPASFTAAKIIHSQCS